jgi:hypothetical protein
MGNRWIIQRQARHVFVAMSSGQVIAVAGMWQVLRTDLPLGDSACVCEVPRTLPDLYRGHAQTVIIRL